MKIGSRVRVIGIPSDLKDDPELSTRSKFMKCVGREFVIEGFNDFGMAELNISSITGSIGETVWIEPEFLELISG